MLERVEVIVDTNSIKINNSYKNIVGNIFIRIGNKVFPDKDWSDFVVVILGWWVDELSKIEGNHKVKSFKLNFMDGPLYVKGFLIDNNLVELEFTKERLSKNEVLLNAICDFEQLKQAIYGAAIDLVQELDTKGIDDSDVRKLKIITAKKN